MSDNFTATVREQRKLLNASFTALKFSLSGHYYSLLGLQTYSNYKKHNTVKVFISIAPTSAIMFISSVWGGGVSDKA